MLQQTWLNFHSRYPEFEPRVIVVWAQLKERALNLHEALSEFRKNFSLSAAAASLIALLTTFTGPVLILVEASKVGHLPPNILATWIFAVSFLSEAPGPFTRFRRPQAGALAPQTNTGQKIQEKRTQ